MVYHSVGTPWTVCQRKSLEYYFATEHTIQDSPNARVNTIVLSLIPIGPTILVEWSE